VIQSSSIVASIAFSRLSNSFAKLPLIERSLAILSLPSSDPVSIEPRKVFSDHEYPIGTVVYVLPDSLMAVACGGRFNGYLDTAVYLNIQYVTNLGEVQVQAVHKKLICK